MAKQITTEEIVELSKTKPTRVIRTWLTFQLETTDQEVPEGESMTVPDMTLTIPELLERHTRGQAIPIAGNAIYSEGELPDLRTLDLVEIQELREDLQADIQRLTEDYQRVQDFEAEKLATKDTQPPAAGENTADTGGPL